MGPAAILRVETLKLAERRLAVSKLNSEEHFQVLYMCTQSIQLPLLPRLAGQTQQRGTISGTVYIKLQ
jgi:hypothetical protein